MTQFRLVVPTQGTSYAGKVEATPGKGTFDSVFRLILPSQKTSYSGKAEAGISAAPKNVLFIANVGKMMNR